MFYSPTALGLHRHTFPSSTTSHHLRASTHPSHEICKSLLHGLLSPRPNSILLKKVFLNSPIVSCYTSPFVTRQLRFSSLLRTFGLSLKYSELVPVRSLYPKCANFLLYSTHNFASLGIISNTSHLPSFICLACFIFFTAYCYQIYLFICLLGNFLPSKI